MLVWQLVVVVVDSQSEEGCEGSQPTRGWELVTWLVELTGGLTNVGAAPAWGHCQATELLLSPHFIVRETKNNNVVWCGVVYTVERVLVILSEVDPI